MMRHHLLGMPALGFAVLLTVLSCASAENGQRRELANGFNKGLGQFKDSRIIQGGQPSQCTAVQNGGGEICEWRMNGSQLLYRYDANGIARSWSYTDSQLGRMESAQFPDQSQQSEGSVWQSVKEAFRGLRFGPASSGSSPTGR